MEQQPSVEVVQQPQEQTTEIVTEGVTKLNPLTYKDGNRVEYQGKLYTEHALRELSPQLFKIQADNGVRQGNTNFGTQFPGLASKGDLFVRVDVMPNKVFKYDGIRWIEVRKDITASYIDEEYIKIGRAHV